MGEHSPTPALHEGHGDRLADRLSDLEHVNRDDLGGGHAQGVQCASGANAEAPPGIARNRVPASADGPTMLCMANGAAAETSLYERLGGVYTIAVVVDDFIDRIMVDPRLNANPRVDEAHHRVSAQGFKFYVTEQVCWAAGGPQTYSGRTMLDAHRELGISGAEWDAFMEDFHQTLAKFGVPERERGELDAIVESTKGDIVTTSP